MLLSMRVMRTNQLKLIPRVKPNLGECVFFFCVQMRNESVDADEVTYQQAIEALANEGLWEEATTLYVKGIDGGLRMTPRSYDMVAGVREANGQGHDLREIGERRKGKERGQ